MSPGPAALKARIEAADRAAALGAHGRALRLLVDAKPAAITPDHDHTCPGCGEAWSHLDEPCDAPAAAMRCGECERAAPPELPEDAEPEPDPILYPW